MKSTLKVLFGRDDGEENSHVEIEDIEGMSASLSDILAVIKNERRRETLKLANDNEDGIDLGLLSEEIACICEGVDRSDERYKASMRKKYYVSLYQCHLDKMENAMLIEQGHEGPGITVLPTEDTERAANLIELLERVCSDE